MNIEALFICRYTRKMTPFYVVFFFLKKKNQTFVYSEKLACDPNKYVFDKL